MNFQTWPIYIGKNSRKNKRDDVDKGNDAQNDKTDLDYNDDTLPLRWVENLKMKSYNWDYDILYNSVEFTILHGML